MPRASQEPILQASLSKVSSLYTFQPCCQLELQQSEALTGAGGHTYLKAHSHSLQARISSPCGPLHKVPEHPQHMAAGLPHSE